MVVPERFAATGRATFYGERTGTQPGNRVCPTYRRRPSHRPPSHNRLTEPSQHVSVVVCHLDHLDRERTAGPIDRGGRHLRGPVSDQEAAFRGTHDLRTSQRPPSRAMHGGTGGAGHRRSWVNRRTTGPQFEYPQASARLRAAVHFETGAEDGSLQDGRGI